MIREKCDIGLYKVSKSSFEGRMSGIFIIYNASGETSPRVLTSRRSNALNTDFASSPSSDRESMVS